jgi:hypothetical protein
MVVQRRETSTPYANCPTTEIQAPVEVVRALLTEPTGWGSFFDVRVDRIDPPGSALVGQRIEGESGPRLLHLKLVFQFTGIDVEKYRLMLDVKLPFGITVREDLYCTPIDLDKCRVDYRCEFGFPTGWRGTLARLLTHRERGAGPINSLSRLKRAAEQRYIDSRMNSGTRAP